MSVIGENIRRYRTEKNITQEQLGEHIGVTTQAVSRWERGGTPDAELLPLLADALGVSIDALYGRSQHSLAASVARQISRMEEEEAYRYAFRICWAINFGLMRDKDGMDDYFKDLIETAPPAASGLDYFTKFMQDGGISTTRFSPDFKHFFLMIEPKAGIKDQLSDPEALRKVFAVFADEKLLRIIFYLYSRLNKPIATSLICKNTGLSVTETDRCMDILLQNNLVTRDEVATAEGEIFTYQFRQESSVIPLLCYADEILKTDFRDFIISFDRTKPLL